MGNLVYLCERGYHVILSVHGWFCDRASLQKTGAQASLQGLGLPGRAASLCPDTFMDCVGLGERKTIRVTRRGSHCCHRHSDLFYLEDPRPGAKAEFRFKILRKISSR